MKTNRDPDIYVDMCWEINKQRKCATLKKEEAYATKYWVEKNNGCVWWFAGLDR